MDSYSLIMIDKPDWHTLLGPQYIIGSNFDPIRVYMGINPYSNDSIGLWVKKDDHHKINHSLSYVFLNDVYYDIDLVIGFIESKGYDNLFKNVDDRNSLAREHVHIGTPFENFDISY